ncbi:hypothetical protein KM043_008302 [Ampulex compressa]|nr:hypothetical protein KM043_008302 [Ampulex compressa]
MTKGRKTHGLLEDEISSARKPKVTQGDEVNDDETKLKAVDAFPELDSIPSRIHENLASHPNPSSSPDKRFETFHCSS